MLKQVERDKLAHLRFQDDRLVESATASPLAHLRFRDDNKGRDPGMPKQVRHDISGARHC